APGEEHAADGGILADDANGLAQLPDRLLVERVELVGAVDGEGRDPVLDVVLEVLVVGHARGGSGSLSVVVPSEARDHPPAPGRGRAGIPRPRRLPGEGRHPPPRGPVSEFRRTNYPAATTASSSPPCVSASRTRARSLSRSAFSGGRGAPPARPRRSSAALTPGTPSPATIARCTGAMRSCRRPAAASSPARFSR